MLAGRTGRVLGVETSPKLVQTSLSCLERWQQTRGKSATASITIRCGNAWQASVTEGHGPFDAIHVGAAADHLPQVGQTFMVKDIKACLLSYLSHGPYP